MATRLGTIDFLLEQMAGAGPVSARKMFGEYAIYCAGKLVALVCDDQLFLKPTAAGQAYLTDLVEASPYPGAKPCFLISAEHWEDADWLSKLVRISAAELKPPAKKARVKK